MAEDENMPAEGSEGAKKWYTVREAAEYLGVSEPTIFRWMKEGTLSYYKVGGSTRFSQDGLDVLFEKTTGSKEAEQVVGRCAACGHAVLVEGHLRGAGRLYFRPEKSSFWVMAEAMTPTHARVCTACGYMHLYADTAKLKKLKAKPVEEKPRDEDRP